MLFRYSARFFVFASGLLTAGNLYVFGTFDLNKNGKSELLKVGGLVAPLEYVELGSDGVHKTLWTFFPDSGGTIVDAKFSDLNQDGDNELVVLLRSGNNSEWLKVFEWNGKGFSSNQESIRNGAPGTDKIRPGNLASYTNFFSVSMASPARRSDLFTLQINDGLLEKPKRVAQSVPLIKNGYGPVYTGLFSHKNETFVALVSPEGNVLKTTMFSVANPGKAIMSDIFVMNGARVILGPDIQPFDEDKDGHDELLIPFATGEVYALGISDNGPTFIESRLSQAELFGMKSAAGEFEINNTILARVEKGLYESIANDTQPEINDSLLHLVSDTLLLGDTLALFLLPDSLSDFYSFNWQSPPPSGMHFNPTSHTIEWIPTRDHIGVVDLSYALKTRLKEELISGEDTLGDIHYMQPILMTGDSSVLILVGDTIKPPKPFVLIPTRFHQTTITTKDIDEKDRFIFEGETPFSTNSANINGVVSVGVAVNLSTVKQDKTSAFNFKSSAEKPDSIVTLSLIHDLDSNILYTSLYPPLDTIPQSFDPEGLNTSFHQYPEYFFEGFPSDLNLDSTSAGALTLLNSDQSISGTISMSSPLNSQDHEFLLSYYGGRPHAIRGDVIVKENGSHKTLTEIDFDMSFSPVKIFTTLQKAYRDTFVFHVDSIPDTLKAKTNFQTFYSPAIVLKDKTPTDTTQTMALPVEALNSSKLTIQPDSTQVEQAPSDSTVISTVVSTPAPTDTLSVTPNKPAPFIPDSTVFPEPEAVEDST